MKEPSLVVGMQILLAEFDCCWLVVDFVTSCCWLLSPMWWGVITCLQQYDIVILPLPRSIFKNPLRDVSFPCSDKCCASLLIVQLQKVVYKSLALLQWIGNHWLWQLFWYYGIVLILCLEYHAYLCGIASYSSF